ncbi:MAG: hypothetical protein ACRD12_11120 [Acidimicrobiales bacterium]
MMRLAQRRRGIEVLEFFAANDAQLSLWLEGRTAVDREEITRELDDVLAAVGRERFEECLSDLVRRRRRTEPGSTGRAQANALIRMLGYEYERIYELDAQDLLQGLESEAQR